MNRCVALAGAVSAACLAPPDEGRGKVDGGGVVSSPDATIIAADASPCPAQFRDDFDRAIVGEAWTDIGDPGSSTYDLEDGALLMSATSNESYAWAALHTGDAFDVLDFVLEAHVDPMPSGDGDVAIAWLDQEADSNLYIGISAISRDRVSIIDGVRGGTWVEPCDPGCPDFQPGRQRWRIRPEGDMLAFEVSHGGGAWQALGPPQAPKFAVGRVVVWTETVAGLTSSMATSVVTVSSCE